MPFSLVPSALLGPFNSIFLNKFKSEIYDGFFFFTIQNTIKTAYLDFGVTEIVSWV